MLPSPSELAYFAEISKTLNISRAAERLGVTQPTLSLAIKRLEDSFGVPLLVRTKSGVKLTASGRKLQQRSQSLLLEWEQLRSDAIKDESELRGSYTLGCHPSVGLYALSTFLPELLLENKGLEIRLVHDLSRKITEDIISFKIDFGLVVNPWRHPDLIIKPLCKDEVTLWTSPKPSPLQDLSGEGTVLVSDPDLIQTQSLMRQLSKKGFRFERTVTSRNLEIIAEQVKSGVGIGILPGRVAKRFGLKAIEKAPAYSDKHCLVYRADAQKSKASRAIAKFIETRIVSH